MIAILLLLVSLITWGVFFWASIKKLLESQDFKDGLNWEDETIII